MLKAIEKDSNLMRHSALTQTNNNLAKSLKRYNKKKLRKWDAFIVNFIASRTTSRRQNSNINMISNQTF